MRRLIIILFGLIIAAMVFVNRQTIFDFVSNTNRAIEAPEAQSFDDVISNSTEEPEETPASEPFVSNDTEVSDAVAAPIEPISVTSNSSPSTPSSSSTTSNPSTFNLAVPFTSQAPLANWDLVHEDTCEEAALYMIHKFYEGKPAGKIDPNTADAELLNIVKYEMELFGFFESTTAAQIATLVEQMYGYEKVEVIENPTIDDLKNHIVAGRPIIVPTAGRLLGNPNFTGEGPLYHALVLKGYTETNFVTNDPGTRLGADYQYDFDTVMNAMHDWNGGEVTSGAKVVVVIYPN